MFLFLIGIILQGCDDSSLANSDTENSLSEHENNSVISSMDDKEEFSKSERAGKFEFKLKDGEFGPESTINVLSDGEVYLVDEILGAANLIDKFEYESMQIPGDAISACGAWWAGGGDYFYLRVSSDQLIVYAGWLDEMAPDEEGYHWEERMRIH